MLLMLKGEPFCEAVVVTQYNELSALLLVSGALCRIIVILANEKCYASRRVWNPLPCGNE